MAHHSVWDIKRPDNFYEQVRRLTLSAKRELYTITNKMIHSDNPTEFGIKIDTEFSPAYVANLNHSERIVYTVDFNKRIIQIIRVGYY